jgi:hypothetical protein
MEKNKFESEIINIMDLYFNNDKLDFYDITKCRNICDIFENKIEMNRLSKKLNDAASKYSMNIEKSSIVYYNMIDNKNTNNEDKSFIINIGIDFIKWQLCINYDILEEYSDDKKHKYLMHNLKLDGYLIIKKNNNNSSVPFINITYIEELINNHNLNISVENFLELIGRVFNIYICKEIIGLICEDLDKYRFNKEWESITDISLINDSDSDSNADV